jgi:hypothetical protein
VVLRDLHSKQQQQQAVQAPANKGAAIGWFTVRAYVGEVCRMLA